MGVCKLTPPINEHEIQRFPPKIQPKVEKKEVQLPSSFINSPREDAVFEITGLPQLSQKMENIRQKLQKQLCLTGREVKGEYIDKAYQLQNNLIYIGQWKEGKIYGKGKFYLPDDSYFQCFFDNQPVGNCFFIKPNEDYYIGEIENYQANGNGKMKEANVLYEGKFKNNLPHGKGKEEGPNYTYEGQYERGTKLSGKMTWNLDLPTPSIYVGCFYEEKFNGNGIICNEKGKFEGSFIDNKKTGFGTFYYKNGARFEGTYQNNKKNGIGRMISPEGKVVLSGKWKNDQPPSLDQPQSQ